MFGKGSEGRVGGLWFPRLTTARALRTNRALLEDIQGVQAFVQVGRLQGNLLEICDIHWIPPLVRAWSHFEVECWVLLRRSWLGWRGLVVQTQSLVAALGDVLIDEEDL